MSSSQSPTRGVAIIERTIDLPGTPERVWRALTESGELASWLGEKADLRPQVGYDGWVEWEGHGHYPIRVVEAVAPVRLAWRWMNESTPTLVEDRATLVEWDLEPRPGGGTRVRLRESGFPDDGARTGNATGWDHELGDLLAWVGDDRWERGLRRTIGLAAPLDRVWAAFADADGFAAWWPGTAAPADGAVDWLAAIGRAGITYQVDQREERTHAAWTWVDGDDPGPVEMPAVMSTWCTLRPRDDGGTNVAVLETGFASMAAFEAAAERWDDVLEPALRAFVEARG